MTRNKQYIIRIVHVPHDISYTKFLLGFINFVENEKTNIKFP